MDELFSIPDYDTDFTNKNTLHKSHPYAKMITLNQVN